MRFTTKLAVFAVALTAVLSAYRLTERLTGRGRAHREVVVAEATAGPAIARVAELPPVPDAPRMPEAPLPREHVRIMTQNHAAFLSLRGDALVAGLTDSIRQAISVEMRRDMAKDRVGEAIGRVVRSGVEKLLEKEIRLPVSEIRDIDYRANRIVIMYRSGGAPGVINLESIKSDGDRTLLEQFREDDARRLVAAVKEKIKR